MSFLKGIRIHTKLWTDEPVMLTYDAEFGEPIGTCRTAVLMTFKDQLIERLELFLDARPFEKNSKKDASFSSR